jgi:hypothetical protein
VQDVREFNIDDIMAQADTPIFYCYYKTTAGDVLGKLLFTDQEMIFEPLNDYFKGFFNYSSGSL